MTSGDALTRSVALIEQAPQSARCDATITASSAGSSPAA